jgi:hypothetical protein
MLSAIQTATQTVQLSVGGYRFEAPKAYSAGAQIGEPEAQVLQGLVQKRIRAALRGYITDEKAAGRAPQAEGMRQAVASALTNWQFDEAVRGAATRRGPGRVARDPIENRMRKIATSNLRKHLVKSGKNPKEYNLQAMVDQYVAQHQVRLRRSAEDALAAETAAAEIALQGKEQRGGNGAGGPEEGSQQAQEGSEQQAPAGAGGAWPPAPPPAA